MHQALAGIYDRRAAFDATSGAAALGRVLEPGDVLAHGPLAAVRADPVEAREAGRFVCLLAGRVFNLAEVASEAGVEPDSDPEAVLAAAYAVRGAAMLAGVSGSFALLLWDRELGRGVVAQDQVASRSLYYSEAGGRLTFASDVAPLLRALPARPGPDRVALVHWIANSSPPERSTLHEGVQRLGPGYMLELADGRWERRSYWAPSYRTPARRSRAELSEELWHVLSRAVGSRIGEDEQVGIVMSGGVDSSTVAAAATAAAGASARPPRGYSAVFPGRERIDESAEIDALTAGLGLPSVQLELRPGGVVRLALEYLRRFELPLSGPGYVLEQPLLAHAAADGVVAVLDGQGGDEVYGLSPYLLADRLRHGRLVSSLRLARSFPLALENPPWGQSLSLWKSFGVKAAFPHALHARLRRRRGRAPEWLSPESQRVFRETNDPIRWKRDPGGPLWWAFKAWVLTTNREQVGLGEYLRHRAALAGLDARPPLLDVGLVELSLAVPPELCFDRRFDRPLARDAVRGIVPEHVRIARQKSNLAPFYHECVTGPDLDAVRRLLQAPDAEVRAFVRSELLDRLLDRPPRVGEPGWLHWLNPVWGALTAECWLRQQSDPGFADRFLAAEQVAHTSFGVHRSPARASVL
jgi:asparagine synthase (glutamine-hydrolysing)